MNQSMPTASDNTEMDLSRWDPDLELAALKEGWILSESYGSENGPLQVQRVDDPQAVREADSSIDFEIPTLASDDVAWERVREGSEAHHLVARELLARYNPSELTLLMQPAS